VDAARRLGFGRPKIGVLREALEYAFQLGTGGERRNVGLDDRLLFRLSTTLGAFAGVNRPSFNNNLRRRSLLRSDHHAAEEDQGRSDHGYGKD